MPESATRLVSLHDVDARPIRKGRLGKPVEFGYKAQIVDNADGVILDHNVEIGNPPDAPQLAPAIQRITHVLDERHARSPPTAVTARHRWNATYTSWGCATWRSRARANQVLPT
jgi:IS5 family transposase